MDVQLQSRPQTNNFQTDIIKGLTQKPKKLSSKYFYDEKGDALFQQIMKMPEYYLSRCELDIFKNKTAEVAELIASDHKEPFDLIELGAGDASKSTHLLKYLVEQHNSFTYIPIDISKNILNVLEKNLSKKIPDLEIQSLEGEYFEMLGRATSNSSRKKVVLFLGGNIGNMDPEETLYFCKFLNEHLSKGDLALIGFDLQKNPQVILDAYNDKAGITAAFNLNLLTRINRELDGNFDLKNFQHYQHYDPETGACRSFLVSLCTQEVTISGKTFYFEENELIDMEISQKFTESDIDKLRQKSGFRKVGNVKDSKNWFVDSVWKV